MAKNNKTINRLQVIWNMIGGDEGADALIEGRKRIEIKDILIKWINTTRTTATTKRFIARNQIKLKEDGGIFLNISEDFRLWFLVGRGKIEDPLDEQYIRYGVLDQNADEDVIIEEQGGQTKVKTTLTELIDLISEQSNGEEGPLLTNSAGNIFYIPDINGILRAVYVFYDDGGWGIYAYSVVNSPSNWGQGYRVFSRRPTKWTGNSSVFTS